MKTPFPTQAVMTYDAPTRIQGRNLLNIKPQGIEKIPGGTFPRHRKQIVITNEDPNTAAYIVNTKDGGADPQTVTEKLLRLGTGESVTLFTNAEITIKNLSGSTLSDIQVLEVYYV